MGAVFGGVILTCFAKTSFLLGYQKFAPVESWDEAASQLEEWLVFCTVLLGTADLHPTTAEMMALVEYTM